METLGTSYQNLDYHIYQALKEMIINRTLLPGTKILQEKLAKELGISRTPLINALKKLEHDRFVSAIPRRGFYVKVFSRSEMIQIFQLREVLEGLTARRTAALATDHELKRLSQFFAPFANPQMLADTKRYARADRAFHSFLITVGGSGMIADLVESFRLLDLSYQLSSQDGLVRMPQQTYPEHVAIVSALQKRQGDRAEELLRRHLRTSLELLEKQENRAESR